MTALRLFALLYLSNLSTTITDAALWNRLVVFPSVRCTLRLAALRFDETAYDRFDEFFSDESELRVAETGRYKGAHDIVE
jgi:hypothetical protein